MAYNGETGTGPDGTPYYIWDDYYPGGRPPSHPPGGGGAGPLPYPGGQARPPSQGEGPPPIDATMIGVMNGVFPNNFVNMQAYLSANQHTGVGGTYQHNRPASSPYGATGALGGAANAVLGNATAGRPATTTGGMDALDNALQSGYESLGGQYWTDKTNQQMQTAQYGLPSAPPAPWNMQPGPKQPPGAPPRPGNTP